MKAIVRFWGVPTGGIEFNDDGAKMQLLREMECDLETVWPRAVAALDFMTESYEDMPRISCGMDRPAAGRSRAGASGTTLLSGWTKAVTGATISSAVPDTTPKQSGDAAGARETGRWISLGERRAGGRKQCPCRFGVSRRAIWSSQSRSIATAP